MAKKNGNGNAHRLPGGASASVVKTGGTKKERLTWAAENDVKTFTYALGKAESALDHAEAKVKEFKGKLAEAQKRLAAAQKERQAEIDAGA